MSKGNMSEYDQIQILEEYRIAAIEVAAFLSLNPYKLIDHEVIQEAPAQVRSALSSMYELSTEAHAILYKLMKKDKGIDRQVLYQISKLYHETGVDIHGIPPF